MRLVPLKSGFVISLLGMAMVAGLYLAGWLTLELLDLSVPLKLTTYYDYWSALELPQVAPYVTKIKAAGAIGFGVPLLGWLLLLIPLFRTRDKKSTHGDARFATRSDLAKSGLLKEDSTGIIVGKIDGQFLRLPGTRHALAAAPTRSGKGVGLVIRYRVNDPFVFCTQGQDPKRFPDRCWIPLPPYTGNYMMMPYCDPPNSYGKSWTNADWDSLYQYERVCPQAQTSGGWEGSGQPEQTPFTH